ncbi:uncharacterized protein LOC126977882 [Leptidea sinapis]|uniref:uncharacterized protein LOC126977882 n=1 Tax=Leptidea sinapis TaxID=189913 RepID=UPI0021C30C25|nr:uncharacterized protein LOC126977882 [Leptidea sinapis]
MNTRVIKWIIFNLQFNVFGVLVKLEEQQIEETKIELSPLLIPCSLEDIVIINAPIITNNTQYYLNKPNGDVKKLNIHHTCSSSLHNIIAKNRTKEVINASNFKITNENSLNSMNVFDNEVSVACDEFMIGPLGVEDHGNWVLSAFEKDEKWIEVFQVISIEIVENILASPPMQYHIKGDNFELSFPYSIDNLESCELIKPNGSRDRYYNRTRKKCKSCGYIVPNVTENDEGQWTIVGVGNIVYKTSSNLIIERKHYYEFYCAFFYQTYL